MASMQPQMQTVNPASLGGVGPMVTSLYVGDLEANITDSQLYDLFSQIGNVVTVRVCRDLISRHSLGYGYVNYSNPQDAERALQALNFTPLNGKSIRIMYSHRDPSIRRSGAGNIFIKNLDKEIDHKALHETFSAFGNILSCKIATDASGQSLGFGFVQYASGESGQKAIETMNGLLLNGKQVYVGPFLRKQERESSVDKTKFTNVFVKNLSEATTDEDLKKEFGEYGPITSVVVMKNEDGTSRCFGFVNFENVEDAARAVESLNGKQVSDKEWYVGRAQKKYERDLELKHSYEQKVREAVEKSQGLNLYVKNLDDSVGDDNLKELFSPFGSITSCKVMRDPKGISRGSGFVAFSSPEGASRALSEMNGKMIVNKALYVALAQRKEDRRARLQAQFAQIRPITMAPTVAPLRPMYTPGGPGFGQHIFYSQPPPSMISPRPGFGYQQQLIPGMRPAGPLMSNMFAPMVQQGQQGPRPGAVPMQSVPPPLPLMRQQMVPRGRGYSYPPGRGMPDASLQGVAGSMLPVPYEMGGLTSSDQGFSHSIPVGALISALANASPTEQTRLLGENLYPLVEQLEPEAAAKVTGMLLEMDQTEVLHLLESPEALRAKIAEAMDVLRNASPAKQLASLSLNE